MINSNNCALIRKVAVVTGANKGIGFEIAKKLGAAGCKTILAARNTELGKAATLELKSLGYDVEFRQLDIRFVYGYLIVVIFLYFIKYLTSLTFSIVIIKVYHHFGKRCKVYILLYLNFS